jgi:hypothetical protein
VDKGQREPWAQAERFADGMQPVRTYTEVVDAWEEISGQKISRARVYQILIRAHEKLRDGLRPYARDYFDDPTL